jgi:outer membrane PBP1 activator LpoA protein
MDQSGTPWVIISSSDESGFHVMSHTMLSNRRRTRRGFTAVILLSTLVAIAGCQSTGPTRDAGETLTAEAAYAGGKYEQAANAWQKEALNATPQAASSLWISAADAWMLAGQPGKARDALRWVDRDLVSRGERARLDLVLADLALDSRRPDEAEILLRKAEVYLPPSSAKRYDRLYARLLQQLSGPSSRELAQAAQIGDSMNYYDPTASLQMMQTLEYVSSGELAIRAVNPRAERNLTAWLDLALVIRNKLVEPQGIQADIAAWKQRHPYHLLTESQALDTFLRYRQTFGLPSRVAVLLPGAGRLQAPAQAIRDGLMNAYLGSNATTELLFFPTNDDPQSSIAAYFSALDAGADLIIGPLRKESVEAMLGLAGMSTPVLALNDLPPGFLPPAGLDGQVHGISMSQDEEVKSIAGHAVAFGFQRAIVLAPESAWGERMAAAFQDEFLHEDRQIVAALRYAESQNDHSNVLERALKIDESNARKRQIENTLQAQVEFEPVRREDVDVIFLAASVTQARLIRPQLRFHDAGDIPVYATGRVYNGQPDPAGNRDLNGIRFPTTYWQLRHAERSEIPDLASLREGSLAALYALGQDAWNVLPWLDLMNRDRGFTFTGQSGAYRAGDGKTLGREPAWAEFRSGRPSPLPPPAPVQPEPMAGE